VQGQRDNGSPYAQESHKSCGRRKGDEVTEQRACALPSQGVGKGGQGAYEILEVAEGLPHVHLCPFAH
jgi:hypothetical protein